MIEPLFEHRRSFAGYETRVLELEGQGPPRLLIHGYADSADTWRLSMALMAKRGQRAIAVDLPGFGCADPLADGLLLPQFDRFIADALAYAAGRPRRPVIAVGNSLGGCVALRLAERHPDRLAGVLALAPAGLVMNRLLQIVRRDPVLRSLLALPTPVPAVVLRAAVANLYVRLAVHKPHRLDPRVVSTFTYHHRRRAAVASYLDIAHRLIPELDGPFELDRIRVPVLLLWGENDRLLYHRGAQQVLDAVPGSRLELWKDIGHCPQVEAPARFTELLLGYSDELAPAAAA
jgi:pimeloyl-ACP methyl ester carboxylesterase